MAAGFLFQNTCYATIDGATAAHWSVMPASFLPGSSVIFTDVSWSGAVWQIKKYQISSGGALTLQTTTNVPALSFPVCDTTEQFFDGQALGWGVAAAMVAAFAVKFIARALSR